MHTKLGIGDDTERASWFVQTQLTVCWLAALNDTFCYIREWVR